LNIQFLWDIKNLVFVTVKIGGIGHSKSSGTNYQSSRNNIPENISFRNQRFVNLHSRTRTITSYLDLSFNVCSKYNNMIYNIDQQNAHLLKQYFNFYDVF
jgi:hypothetical protein